MAVGNAAERRTELGNHTYSLTTGASSDAERGLLSEGKTVVGPTFYSYNMVIR
ncbi:hypothetical protein J21TS7_57040 [Paenibacillus cineris]|uniref:Uncharacterized protein n=1 Tax=Paenibacillus cineris TaxID=237530 RepID=A0ABQ4LLK7_9BACL|nr:hypothetical protein J21TS7_57040 [Paenibacillus cineris]